MGLQASCLAPSTIGAGGGGPASIEPPSCTGGCFVPPTACMDHHDTRTIGARTTATDGAAPELLNFRSVPSLSSTACCSGEHVGIHVQARYGTSGDALRAARQYAKGTNPHDAYLAYAAAHDMDEENAGLCNEFGQFLLSLGHLEEAEYLFNQALAIDPSNPEYCYRKGVVLQQRRLPVEAAQAFTTALRQDPHFVGAMFNLGVTHRELGDPRSAAEDFRRILQLEPENEGALALLGECLAEMGDYDGAVRTMEEAIRLDPSNRSARRDLHRIKERQSEPVAAHA